MRACPKDVPTRGSMCLRMHVGCGAHDFSRKRAGPFRRRGPRVARLAGVLHGDGVQREHRRVEHRVCFELLPGMRRFRPAARTAADALGRS